MRLRPKVKPAWAPARPKQPRSAMDRMSLRFRRLPDSRSFRIRRRRSPPAVKRSATIGSGGRNSAAYLVAAKLPPQKRAARISETSVSAACLLIPFSPSKTGEFYDHEENPATKPGFFRPFGDVGARMNSRRRQIQDQGASG